MGTTFRSTFAIEKSTGASQESTILLGLLSPRSLIPAWISNYTHYNVWDEITYAFLNFNGATVEV